jgi:hypothetical protein
MENSNTSSVIFHSVFRIGVVCSVDGREVKVRVDKDKNTSHILYKGTLIKNVSVGAYIKIVKGFTPIIGKVDAERIIPKDVIQDEYHSKEDEFERQLTVKLVGYLTSERFERGIAELPLIDNECFLLDGNEFKMIHSYGDKDEPLLTIGSLSTDSQVKISIGVNKLFASHIGIFGNTGSGKSYTLSKLYHELFEQFKGKENFYKNAKFLFFDFNGEYSGPKSISEGKTIYSLNTRKDEGGDKLPLSSEDFLDVHLLSIFANATEKTQRPFISRSITLYKKISGDVEKAKDYIKAQICQVLEMSDKVKGDLLLDYLEQILPPRNDAMGVEIGLRSDIRYHNTNNYYYFVPTADAYKTNFRDNPFYETSTIIYKQVDQFVFSDNMLKNFIVAMYMQLIYDVLNNRAMNEHIAPAINKLNAAAPSIGKVFDFSGKESFWATNKVIVNLRDVNLDMRKMIPMILTNKFYTEKKRAKKKDTYLNFVVDEAHNVLSRQSERESEEWKDYRLEVFEEVIKEGRKFGIFLTIASQRPSDISPTIISQLHNYFIHRLMNEKDIEQIRNTISYLDQVSVESLPILTTGTCVLAGQLVEMPIVVKIDRITEGYQPDNTTINVIDAWS